MNETTKTGNVQHVETTEQLIDKASRDLEYAANELDETKNGETSPGVAVSNAHNALNRALREISEAVKWVDNAERDANQYADTPRKQMEEAMQAIEERYTNPRVKLLALELAGENENTWLRCKPRTNGADSVRETGLTTTQLSTLDALDAALSSEEE